MELIDQVEHLFKEHLHDYIQTPHFVGELWSALQTGYLSPDLLQSMGHFSWTKITRPTEFHSDGSRPAEQNLNIGLGDFKDEIEELRAIGIPAPLLMQWITDVLQTHRLISIQRVD